MENDKENGQVREVNYHAALYRTFAIIFFVLAAGGLFLGMLAQWKAIFAGAFTVVGGPKGMEGSLFSFVWVVFKQLFGGHPVTVTGIWVYLELALVILLVIAVLASIICMIVSLCSKASAKTCALVSGSLVTVSYLLFATVASVRLLSEKLSVSSFDLPLCIIAAVSLILLGVTAIIVNKGRGVIGCIGVVLALCAYFGFTFPGSSMSGAAIIAAAGQISLLSGKAIQTLIGFVLYYLLLIGVVISVCRIFAKRGYAFEAFWYCLLLIAAVLYFVFYALSIKSFAGLFKGTSQLIATILLLAVLFVAFIFFLVLAIKRSAQRKRELYDELFDDEEEDEEAVVKNHVAPTYVTNINTVPATAGAPGAQPMPQPMMFYPIQAAPYYAPVMQPVIQQVAPAAPQPAPKAPAEPVPYEETPMSEFENRMAALARGEMPEAEQPAPAAPQAPAPAYAPQPAPQPAQQQLIYGQYVYDPFFNSLSNDEKKEFGDLFIGLVHGNFGLPVYEIGGNNEEFFRHFFVYLGKIRPYISTGMLEKIYNYINHI